MIEMIRQGLKADGFDVSIRKLCRWSKNSALIATDSSQCSTPAASSETGSASITIGALTKRWR